MSVQPVSSTSPNQVKSTKKDLSSDDFIKMMLTQLQNQDPLSPAKNQDLMAQMSQISQLQSSTQMQDLLKGLSVQNQIGSAGNLIGKMVEGQDANDDTVKGLVTRVRVEKDKVYLELDNGQALSLDRVTSISAAPSNVAPSAASQNN